MRDYTKAVFLVFVSAVLILGVSGTVHAETGCSAKSPEVVISPSELTSPPGETAVFTVEVQNEDSDNCPIKQFKMNGTSEGGFSVSFSPSVLFLSPDDSETTLMKVSVTSGADATQYEVKAVANNGEFSGIDTAILDVREEVEECEVKVSSLRFKEKNSDEFENEFAKDDEVSAFIDVSLLGNVQSDVTLDLFADGSVIESHTETFPGDSDTTFRFGNKIFTKNYNDNVDLEVVATASCNPTESDTDEDTIEILESEEDVDIDVRVGRPANTVVGKEVVSRVFIENNGAESVDVNLDGFFCGINSGCKEMDCGDSTIFVEEDDTMEFVCRYTPTAPGKYNVEVEVTFENDDDREDSQDFLVYSTAAELAGQTAPATVGAASDDEQAEKIKEIRSVCTGNLRQAVFTTTSGVKISDIEFCPNGCSHGSCVQRSVITKKITNPIEDMVSGGPDTEPSKPQYNKPEFGTDDFLGWLKNLWFSITS